MVNFGMNNTIDGVNWYPLCACDINIVPLCGCDIGCVNPGCHACS